MANLDLTVSKEERIKFNNENRPTWPRVPTPCPVTVCGVKKYNKFKDFLVHCKQTYDQKHLKVHLKALPSHKAEMDQIIPNIN